jgi:hypothetical protein
MQGGNRGNPVPSQPPPSHDGAQRSLLKLVRNGLDEAAVPQAAALALALDGEPAEPERAGPQVVHWRTLRHRYVNRFRAEGWRR